MTLPTPLRMARAIALFQGWAAGIGVFVMLGVAVLAAGGLKNGAFVALALLFLAGDVLAVAVAVVIAARRLAEGAAWARLLLDVVEGVTVAVGRRPFDSAHRTAAAGGAARDPGAPDGAAGGPASRRAPGAAVRGAAAGEVGRGAAARYSAVAGPVGGVGGPALRGARA